MRRVKLPVVISLLAVASMLLIPAFGVAQQKTELPHPKTLPELQQAMKEVIDRNMFRSRRVAGGEWRGSLVRRNRRGGLAAKRAVNCDTEFRVGSISKTFVALALLKLQEDARINLYARLQDVAPEIPSRIAGRRPIRSAS